MKYRRPVKIKMKIIIIIIIIIIIGPIIGMVFQWRVLLIYVNR